MTTSGTAEVNGSVTTPSSVGPTSANGAAKLSDPAISAQARYAKEVNAYVNEHIRFADVKAGAALTLALALGGALGTAVPVIVRAANTKTPTKIVLVVLFISAAVAAVVAIFSSTLSLIPRMPRAGAQSHNSFPDIAECDPIDYSNMVASLTERDIVNDLSIHNVTLSRVAKDKFAAITVASRALLALIVIAFLIAVFYVLASV